jgi:anionic cell wall polymer biosynthesis LytR-Cps2A-Psr (LCP) family protein
MVGGVDINNPSLINDPSYDWLDGVHHGFTLTAGPHHLDGKNALAYVRSRHGSDNNDWKRASRQQEVLISLEHKIASPSMMFQLPDFMRTASASIRTNFPAGQIADMVNFGQSIPKDNISQVVLGPPYSDTNTSAGTSAWTSCLRLDKIAPLSVQFFGTDSRYSGTVQKDTCGG